MEKEQRGGASKNRPCTEALFSLATDQDNEVEGIIDYYARLWGWRRSRVRRFFERSSLASINMTGKGASNKTPNKTFFRHPIRLVFSNLSELIRHRDTTIHPTNPRTINKHSNFPSDALAYENIRGGSYQFSRPIAAHSILPAISAYSMSPCVYQITLPKFPNCVCQVSQLRCDKEIVSL